MGIPLRFLAVLATGFLCLGCCSSPALGQSQQALSSSDSLTVSLAGQDPGSSPPQETTVIPGPLRSFLRMAGISQQIPPSDVLPMLARNVTLWGHENGRETEFLVLLSRYVQLARELQSLAGSDGVIRVADCGDAVRLIQILGYQFQRSCGLRDASLNTSNAERAFLTVDSGFPLTALEQALQTHTLFTYEFPATRVPILFTEKDWTGIATWKKGGSINLVDILLHDANVDRLYAALARIDEPTRIALGHSPGLRRLLPNAAVLDFYGSQICIRSGAVILPGGASAGHGWQELVGASPNSPGEFVNHLLGKDRGWMAAYYDALSRVGPTQQSHLTESPRLKDLYDSYRSAVANDSASVGVFPKNAELLLLLTRLRWEANGDPQVPGTPDLWREVFAREGKTLNNREWARHTRNLDTPERLLEDLAFASNFETDIGPLQVYLMLTAIDAGRQPGKRLSSATAQLLADSFTRFNNWYPIFAEFPALDDSSIASFVDAADRVDKISNQTLRANALGAFQADIGLWQIFARQGQIPADKQSSSWQSAIHPFAGVTSSQQLFDAARGSLQSTLLAASGNAALTQDQIVDLLAGPAQNTPDGRRVHQELVRRIRAVLEDQRLVSLDTLFGLYDGLHDLAHGRP